MPMKRRARSRGYGVALGAGVTGELPMKGRDEETRREGLD
ncbi:hypothetical protein GQ607_015848 [Colletotrichum asianum]|uniref:Uncharacterized protein n=1 Tax=Colletotrichum asianum TaxID=702518 RepID=A0A8H3VWU8_9PEZI|nr:hypothetical protein GQ607_015848 [Colletotrichum asianum]